MRRGDRNQRSPLGGFVHRCSVVRIWHNPVALPTGQPVRLLG